MLILCPFGGWVFVVCSFCLFGGRVFVVCSFCVLLEVGLCAVFILSFWRKGLFSVLILCLFGGRSL